jgi:hypothetical protein
MVTIPLTTFSIPDGAAAMADFAIARAHATSPSNLQNLSFGKNVRLLDPALSEIIVEAGLFDCHCEEGAQRQGQGDRP